MATKRTAEAIWIESKGYWQVKVQNNGHRKAFTSSIKGRKGKHAAEAKADAWLQNGTKEMRFEAAWKQFLENQKATTGTANYNKHEYIGRLYISPIIKNAHLSSITPNMWRKCIDAGSAADLSRRSIKNIKLSISAFINYCRRERWEISRLERGDIVLPNDAAPPKRKILQPDALKKLMTIDTIIHWRKPEKSFFIHAWRFIVLTGLRRGELCGIKNEDISSDGVVTIWRSHNAQREMTYGKNDNARRVFVLSTIAMGVLNQQRQMLKDLGIKSEWAFPDEHGEQLDSNHLYSKWDTYRNQHELGCSLHELRHTYVSIVQNDMPEPLLKTTVGHSEDMDTYGIYGHNVDGDLQRAADIATDSFVKVLSNLAIDPPPTFPPV